MAMNVITPWHRESFDRLLQDLLPQRLADSLPLGGYRAEPDGEATCRITLSLPTEGEVRTTFAGLPYPDEAGVFIVEGRPLIVLPRASRDDLDEAEIRCVGELLGDYIQERLAQVPADLSWDENLVRAILPMDEWFASFFRAYGEPLDEANWLSRHTDLRRLLVPDRERVFTPGHFGRACPIETPDDANIGRRLVIAVGAAVRDGRLIVEDERPAAAFGLGASVIPFLEHCEPTRPRMGASMMRQWLVPPDPEPAWVQTGG